MTNATRLKQKQQKLWDEARARIVREFAILTTEKEEERFKIAALIDAESFHQNVAGHEQRKALRRVARILRGEA